MHKRQSHLSNATHVRSKASKLFALFFIFLLTFPLFSQLQPIKAEAEKETRNLIWEYNVTKPVSSVSMSSDGSYVAVGASDGVYLFSKDGKLLWNYTTIESLDDIYHIIRPVNSVSMSSDGSYIAAGTSYDTYFFSKDGKLLWKRHVVADSVSMSSDGSYIVAGASSGVCLFSKDGTILLEFPGYVSSISMSSNGSYVLIAGVDGIYLLSKDGGKWSLSLFPSIPISYARVSMSSDGSYVAVGAWWGSIYLLSKDGKLLWNYNVTKPVNSVSISSDGSYIAAGAKGYVYFFGPSQAKQLLSQVPFVAIAGVAVLALVVVAYFIKRKHSSKAR